MKTPTPNAGGQDASWRVLLHASAARGQDLPGITAQEAEAVNAVARRFPMRINAYFLSLLSPEKKALWRQAVPSAEELSDAEASEDPLCEQSQSPVPGIVHRYPDRVVFLAETRCAIHCRHCMRKRNHGRGPAPGAAMRQQALDYIARTPAIREVVVSGGDPLLLEDDVLFDLMDRIFSLPHVRVARIHTRVPGVLPQRISPGLARGLARLGPVFINIQFNHPDELTPPAAQACAMLADAGIPLGSQTVLLRGVNDDPQVLADLFYGLLSLRVKPYYLHQVDKTRGTGHFFVPLQTAMRILESLRGSISGMAVPHFMVDLPGGGGKVPCLPQYFLRAPGGAWLARNYKGKIFPC